MQYLGAKVVVDVVLWLGINLAMSCRNYQSKSIVVDHNFEVDHQTLLVDIINSIFASNQIKRYQIWDVKNKVAYCQTLSKIFKLWIIKNLVFGEKNCVFRLRFVCWGYVFGQVLKNICVVYRHLHFCGYALNFVDGRSKSRGKQNYRQTLWLIINKTTKSCGGPTILWSIIKL